MQFVTAKDNPLMRKVLLTGEDVKARRGGVKEVAENNFG
jgi:hypothetical protein